MPYFMLGKGRISSISVPDMVPQGVVQILPVFYSSVSRGTFGAGRAIHPSLDFESIQADQMGRLHVLDLLEEMKEPRVNC
jgi:hypothetical protein